MKLMGNNHAIQVKMKNEENGIRKKSVRKYDLSKDGVGGEFDRVGKEWGMRGGVGKLQEISWGIWD